MEKSHGKAVVPVESIELLRLDGEPAPDRARFSGFAAASRWLQSLAETFPETGHHRVRFEVRWKNGDVCVGRYAARHPTNTRFKGFNIGRRIRQQADLLVNIVPYHFAGPGRFEIAERILQGELELPNETTTCGGLSDAGPPAANPPPHTGTHEAA
ncbi:MAG: hypothetical protein P8124_03850 [Gammaproteobacteria bacterium]